MKFRVGVAVGVVMVSSFVGSAPPVGALSSLPGVFAGSGRESFTDDGGTETVRWTFPRLAFAGGLPVTLKPLVTDTSLNFVGIFQVDGVTYGASYPEGQTPPCTPPILKDPRGCVTSAGGLLTPSQTYVFFGSFPLHGFGLIGRVPVSLSGSCGGRIGIANWVNPIENVLVLQCNAHVNGGFVQHVVIQGTWFGATAIGDRGADVVGTYDSVMV